MTINNIGSRTTAEHFLLSAQPGNDKHRAEDRSSYKVVGLTS